MSVPDRICGLEARHLEWAGRVGATHCIGTSVAEWRIEESKHSGRYQAVRYHAGSEFGGELYYGASEDDAVAAVEASIREVAAECRAFADKVLGER